MKITKETVKAVVEEKKAEGMTGDEIFEEFKAALKLGLIDLDIFVEACEEVYK